MEQIDKEGILDHAIARLLPIVTSLIASIAASRDNEDDSVNIQNFDTKELSAPLQKNKMQLSFHKVETPGRRKTNLPFK